jgi:16S rRNA (cytosine967-C5)-methyltransferase
MHDAPDAVRFAQMLVFETVRRQIFIDQFINNILKPKDLSELSFGAQAFLRLYVYQTRIVKNWTEADIKEAENIASLARSILGWKTLQKVEPILGMLLTEKPSSVYENLTEQERIAFQTCHPSWFVSYCFKLFGRMETIAMLEANMQQAPTYIRLNTLKMTENEILNKLAIDNVKTEKIEKLNHTYAVLNTKQSLTKTSSYQKGLFYIQDKASCITTEMANPKPAMTVLDVCAAPGAKTTHLAQLMQNNGTIISLDYSKRRMSDWKREVTRMGVSIAFPLIADAFHTLPTTAETDLVLLDPPCTSTGTFRKLPSAKWRLTPHSIEQMTAIQWQMLNNCAEHVKTKGTLVYSTCSITVEENEMIIERFLKWHPQFCLIETSPKLGLPGLRGLDKCQRLYPHIHKCNGSFIAKLEKTSQ